ncbi:MAG: prolipoprotein diacylglyceryl transferase [Erysipelotrichaceae bacterium]|nr:prolipoprotein diacylglyceryl transferase [Erysipelotrichaceae bacterium]
MSFFPNPQTLVEVGPISIQWYAVLILTGAFLAYYLICKEAKRMGYDEDDMDNLFIGALLFGILGARIWYVLFSNLSTYLADPISIIKIWEGGLAIQGGLFSGILFGYFYAKKHKMNFFRFFDLVMPYVLIAQAIGRWGNFVNQEAFGRVVTEAYFEHWPSFLNFIKEGMLIGGSYREPMFFYESILCLIGFALIMLYKKYSHAKRGDLGFCYLLWYGAIRFWIEASRSDSLMFMGLKMAQIISLIFIAIGVLGLLGVFKKWIKTDKPVLLFDLDGTLLDTEFLIRKSFTHVFQQYKPEYSLSEEELLSFMGPTLEESFRKYFDESQIEELVACYREYNLAHHDELVRPLPEAKELLHQWKQEGYHIAVVSSKFRDVVVRGLECCGMIQDVDLVLGRNEYEKAKPDKQGLIRACQLMNVSHDDSIYVGDSHSDILAAKNAGMYSIGYVSNPKREKEIRDMNPNRVIFHLSEINEVLKEDISWTYNLR